jgi:glycosyltransferase involved in cell wall biosynthesis
MKIAFDISQTGKSKAGYGWFAYSLAHELAQRPESCEMTFLRTFGLSWWDSANMDLTIPTDGAEAHYRAGFALQEEATRFWAQNPKELREQLGAPDIIHSNNFFSLPQIPDTRQVYTLYDMTAFDCPQYTTEANRSVCLRGIFKAACNADAIIAISEFTKKSFLDYFDYDPERITMVPLGSRFSSTSERKLPEKLRLGERFILAVGTIEPRKNYDLLLEAFRGLARHDPGVTLVIAGRLGWNMESFELGPQALGVGNRVRIMFDVSDPELAWLYAHCVAFVYLSNCEGFGLPVLEALSNGCAVITSNAASLPEVAGRAALYFHPSSAENLMHCMITLIENTSERERLKSLARSQAIRFSWRSTASLVREAYESVLAMPPRSRSIATRLAG